MNINPKDEPISLEEYIATLGEAEFAVRYDITKRSATAYRYGQRRPKHALAERIVNDKRSPVTWESIYEKQPAAKRRA